MTRSLQRTSSTTFRRTGVTFVAILAGVLAVRGLESVLQATFDKPPAPLAKPLDQINRELGNPVQYRCDKPDLVLEPDMVETLGTNDYLMREYQNVKLKETDPGEFVDLNVNYYATGSSTPHVPEICWAGNGRVEAAGSREVFDVPGVRRKDGSIVTLHVKLISFEPDSVDQAQPNSGDPGVYSIVAYVFQVNGDYVNNPHEVASHFWKATNRYAYHAKIEVTPVIHVRNNKGEQISRAMLCTREQAKQIVSDFLRASVAEVEECLPDPSILTANDTAAGGENKR